MDRFLFRIWDIKQQKYRQRTHHEADTCLDCLLGKVLYGEGIEIYGEEDDKDVVLEQSTGLKDKNGNLVYEGDILKITDQGIDDIVKVYWENGMYCFSISPNSANLVFSDLSDNETTCEIIGNIHANPDLLGEE